MHDVVLSLLLVSFAQQIPCSIPPSLSEEKNWKERGRQATIVSRAVSWLIAITISAWWWVPSLSLSFPPLSFSAFVLGTCMGTNEPTTDCFSHLPSVDAGKHEWGMGFKGRGLILSIRKSIRRRSIMKAIECSGSNQRIMKRRIQPFPQNDVFHL